jgi:hypothetical protein
MPMITKIFTESDHDSVIYERGDFRITQHQNRGYKPWLTLHRRKRFLWLSRWSLCGVALDANPDKLFEKIRLWEEWPPIVKPLDF